MTWRWLFVASFLRVAGFQPRPHVGGGQSHVAEVVPDDEFRDGVYVGLEHHLTEHSFLVPFLVFRVARLHFLEAIIGQKQPEVGD